MPGDFAYPFVLNSRGRNPQEPVNGKINMATPKLYRVILPVESIDEAAEFYRHVLNTAGERVSAGRHYFDCGSVILACYDPSADGDDVGDGWSYHQNQYLYFSVPELESVRRRIAEAGGHDLSPIERMPWGETMFYATDPQGTRLSFVRADTLFVGTAAD